MKRLIIICSVLVASPWLASANVTATFIKMPGIADTRVRRIVLSESHANFMAVATDNKLYVSSDGGDHFQQAVVLKDEVINDLFISNDTNPTVYIAASRGAYRYTDSNLKVFTAREGEEVLSIAQHGSTLFVGTSEGLHHAATELLNWQRFPGIRNERVYSLEPNGHDLYVCCDSGVYLYRSDSTLKRLFLTRASADGDGTIPIQLSVDVMEPSTLWLCTSRGVYRSNDRGERWDRLYINGIANTAAKCLAQFPLDGNHFYLCNDKGFFKVGTRSGDAQQLFNGLPTSNISWVEISASGMIYLATHQGLFKQVHDAPVPVLAQRDLTTLMEGEPSIYEVQEAALRYNSVHPDKTGRWRRRIKYRALMPRLGVDYDKTIGSSFTSSGYYYAEGPHDWGVSLTWDMGNLIWNSYEDDIDNRAKLTTQLRLDILDEVNRLFFERLRLKREIANTPTVSVDTELKQLRLQELTATLNGYTGGLYKDEILHE